MTSRSFPLPQFVNPEADPRPRTRSAVDPFATAQDPSWYERHTLLNRRASEAGAAARVVFLGDSITQDWENAGREVWRHYYARRRALNLGSGGDRTQHVLWRLDHGNVDRLSARVAVLLIGTNDTAGDAPDAAQVAEGVAAILNKLGEKLPDTRVLLLGILPRGPMPCPRRDIVLQVNQLIRPLADGHRVRWLDFGDRYVGLDGGISNELMPDYLHLSTQGYGLWAEAMEDELSAMLGDDRVAPVIPAILGGSDKPHNHAIQPDGRAMAPETRAEPQSGLRGS